MLRRLRCLKCAFLLIAHCAALHRDAFWAARPMEGGADAGPMEGGEDGSNGVDFLRPQKVGGTSFREIMREFCGSQCRWLRHLSWEQMGETGNALNVTLIRDPVERTLSEFHFIRTPQGKSLSRQGQWHFTNSTWLDMVQNTRDVHDALDIYLHGDPLSPSRNRQTLYTLGFSDWSGENQTNVGAMYDWTDEHNRLLTQAKHHLNHMTVFGITDCYLTSMQVIAQTFGWDAQAVVDMAKTVHERQQPELIVNGTSSKWRQVTDPSIVKTIERLNAVDMDLYYFALATFKERFGEDCAVS